MPNSPTNRDRIKEIIARAKEDAARKVATVAAGKAKAAKAAKPPRPAKPAAEKNPRSAAARDARAATRGRLPDSTVVSLSHAAGRWAARMTVFGENPPRVVVSLDAESDGQFDCLEKLDVAFWEWMAALPADAAERAVMRWPPDTGKPNTPATYPVSFPAPVPGPADSR